MHAWDSLIRGGSLRLAPAALGILLTGLLLLLPPLSEPVERSVYDGVLRFLGGTGSPQIVLVDTSGIDQEVASLWDAPAFPQLLRSLGEAGTRLVLPLDPPPASGAFPDSAQIAALAEIARRDAGAPRSAAAAEAFEKRLGDMRRHAELQAATLSAIGSLRNTLVTVPVFEGARLGSLAAGGSCTRHLLKTDATEAAGGMRQARAIAAPPDALCRELLGAGHAEFWADADGVVRRHELLVSVPGGQLPSLALRAALSLSFPSGKPPLLDARSLSWDNTRLRTSAGAGLLMRFYPAADAQAAPFETIDARELLDSPAATQRLGGRIVLLGHAGLSAGDAGYATPTGQRVSAAVLQATALSNILQDDYIVQPAWGIWLQLGLMALIGILALLYMRRIPMTLALAISLCIATAALASEAYLLLGPGLWLSLGGAAIFAVLASLTARISLAKAPAADRPDTNQADAPGASQRPADPAPSEEEELDLAFSVLRQQVPSQQVKERLYEIALEHARRRDLAKAERVLKHLAGIDPGYRRAGEKLQKLAGMRSNLAPAASSGAAAGTPGMRPVLQPMMEPPVLQGQTIGRYRIEEAIGRGAMATVYLGLDPKINRRVAIKTIALADEFDDSDLDNARTQFLREAESAGRLNHPHIINIYDAGEDGQVAYLAMEYFPGKPLSHYVQQGQLLPVHRVLELMARAAEALHYAHGQHVVHRDVKPANIMYDRDTDTLKITDFGIARLTDSSRTKTGIILGTPSYMSPEQLAGTNVTGQSDLFSLGITLYQLLTGYPPFRADSIPRLMQKISHEQHAPVTQVREGLPACLDELIDTVLAKDPSNRYPSGRAMAVALRNCCAKLNALPAVRSA